MTEINVNKEYQRKISIKKRATLKDKNSNAFKSLQDHLKDLINFKLLNNKEKKYLNEYHKKVYLTLNPYLNKSEKHWLKSISN